MLRATFVLLLLFSSTVYSQVMIKGRFGITPYVGLPSAGRVITQSLNSDYAYNYTDDYQFKVTGPAVEFGVKLEYMLTDIIGLALEMNYEKAGYDLTYYGYDNTGTYLDYYHETWSQTKIRGLARMQFHILKSEKVDLYPGFGVGFCAKSFTNPQNTPDVEDYDIFLPMVFIDRVTDPIAARIFFGANFMFTRNIGLNTEVGIGSGSVLKVGLAAYI